MGKKASKDYDSELKHTSCGVAKGKKPRKPHLLELAAGKKKAYSEQVSLLITPLARAAIQRTARGLF